MSPDNKNLKKYRVKPKKEKKYQDDCNNNQLYIIDFEEIHIDFNAQKNTSICNENHPKAYFKLKFLPKVCNDEYINKLIPHVRVHFKAITTNIITVKEKYTCSDVDKYGKFCFDIPYHTIFLQVVIKINNGNCDQKILHSYPEYSDSFFNDDLNELKIKLCVRFYSNIALDTTGLDHTAVLPGENRVYGHQLGPCKSARAMAMVHIAMLEAYNIINKKYKSYLGLDNYNYDDLCNNIPCNKPKKNHNNYDVCDHLDICDTYDSSCSVDYRKKCRCNRCCNKKNRCDKYICNEKPDICSAIIRSAHSVLVHLYPSHFDRLNKIYHEFIAQIPNGISKVLGINIGNVSANSIIQNRINDGMTNPEAKYGIDYIPGTAPGVWRQDPISLSPVVLGASNTNPKPFVLASPSTFRAPPVPLLTSNEYTMAYNEVKVLGGDNIHTPTVRSNEATEIGIYWAYDGAPSLCAPPRLYNKMFLHIIENNIKCISSCEYIRLLTMLNITLVDCAITCWDSKYFYKFWRPITGIRESDPGTGPSGLGDGNPNTIGDINWYPLGAPASNTSGPNSTPPFPAYTSGHAAFGAGMFQFLRRIFATDNIPFTFVSEELNGVTKSSDGHIRPLKPRSFTSFSQAEEENGQSRIYLGIHWTFDKVEGIKQGRKVGDVVFDNLYKPL